MRALILAAGRGTRLGASDGPKCLTRVGDCTLLDRALDSLDALSVPVTIVVGHAANQIERHVAVRRAKPALITNDRYKEGSVVSLATGLATFSAGEDLLLMDGDVAFTPELLDRLVQSTAPDALLVDVGTVFTDEQYMAGMRAERVVMLRRGAADGHEAQGEWVGFTKMSAQSASRFLRSASAQITRGETSGGYEDALAGMLNDIAFTAVPTGGLPWTEIDFADDLARARAMFR